ncbi:MAG TPA: SRPBCC family protein [Allosphingosinicella sp.]|jgi:hypothetical protein
MATAEVQIELGVDAAEAWRVIGDFGAARDLAPGFVESCELRGEERIIAFRSGLVARERLVALDPERRRLVYSARGGKAEHHNAAMEVIDRGPGRCALRWTTDLLPDALSPFVQDMMEQGAAAIARGVEARTGEAAAGLRSPAPRRAGMARASWCGRSLGAMLAAVWMAGSPAAAPAGPTAIAGPRRDGSHDFDFEIGRWKTDLRRLKKPLGGSPEWVHYSGTTTVTAIWGGKANLVELDVEGPTGRLQALSLRLYDPETREWSLNFANSAGGSLAVPSVGAFRDGRGEFYNHETIGGRTVLVRFVISDITPESVRFEQAFSADGGRSWEVNWIVVDTRLP